MILIVFQYFFNIGPISIAIEKKINIIEIFNNIEKFQSPDPQGRSNLDRTWIGILGRNRIGTGSELDRNRVGTGSGLDRNWIGTGFANGTLRRQN